MKMRKSILAFLVAICSLFAIGILGVSAEDTESVYATTSTSVAQGSYAYAYVYLDDMTDLSALTVSVYFDTEKITVVDSYNSVACTMYDSSNKDGCLQFSYIFDGEGSNTKTQLFYFRYQVNNTAEAGKTYFDIIVSDAYTDELEVVNISGSRCAFTITEEAASQTSCSIYSSTSVSTSVEEEFTLSYRLSTYQIASGSFTIQYDPELFEFVELTKDSFLNNKVVDVNPTLSGAVSVSFVGTAYAHSSHLVTVKFRTLKNVAQSSEIKLTVIDFYDLELNSYSCSGYTSKVNITFDETYTEDAPSMYLSSAYNAETSKVMLTVKLEKDAHLGAGDFVLNFDSQKFTYVSSEKGFAPTFFNINDSHVANGILKFSIISMADITDEQTVLTITFDAKHFCEDKLTMFAISGNGLTDSMTNAITLNFVDSNIIIPLKHTAATAVVENKVDATCTADGSYDSVVCCSVCNAEISREAKIITKLGHNEIQNIGKSATCTESGWKEYVTCSRCNYSTYESIDALGHNEIHHAAQTPTCTEHGWNAYVTCSVCDYTTYVEFPAKGHNVSEWITDEEATFDKDGKKHKECLVCKKILEQSIIPMLTHLYESIVTLPTCMERGYTTHTCNHCGNVYIDDYVNATGHIYGEWLITTVPTCTTGGQERRDCENCDHFETRDVVAFGHDTTSHPAQSATCTDIGWNAYETCLRCDYTTYVEIPANGHSYGDWIETVAPTCTENGEKAKGCSVCHNVVTEVVDKLGHDEVTHNAQTATCEQIGWNAYVTCSRCDYTTYVELPSHGGHTFGEWERIIDPTPDTAGMDRRTCSVCGNHENRDVAALGYLQAFINAVETLSENESTENTYSKIYYALQLYSRLTDDERQEASEEFLVLQEAINAYNSKAEAANTELNNATEIAFIPISASFTFLAALWFLLKKKFWIK